MYLLTWEDGAGATGSLGLREDFAEAGPSGWLMRVAGEFPRQPGVNRSPGIDAQAQGGAGHPARSGRSQQADPFAAPMSEFGQLWKLGPLSLPRSACSDLCTFQFYDINQ